MPKLNLVTSLKYCCKCKEDKLPGDFSYNKRTSDKLMNECRECRKVRKDAYVAAYPERVKSSRALYHQTHRENSILRACRQRARNKSLPCTITLADINLSGACPLCEDPFESGRESYHDARASVDMYDPRLGYTPDNSWMICVECNRRKQDMSGEDHVAFGLKLIDTFKQEQEKRAA